MARKSIDKVTAGEGDATPIVVSRLLVVSLPLPPRELAANRTSHAHWSKRHQATAGYLLACKLGVLRVWLHYPPFRRARADFHLEYCSGRRRLDNDGALHALKPAIDALVLCGVLVNDSPKYLDIGSVISTRHKRGCRCDGGVTVRIEER